MAEPEAEDDPDLEPPVPKPKRQGPRVMEPEPRMNSEAL